MAMTRTRKGNVTTRSTIRPNIASRGPEIADEETDEAADDERADGGEESDLQIDLRGGDDAREDVAPELVGSEGMRHARRLQQRREVEGERVVRCHELRCERANDDDGEDREPRERPEMASAATAGMRAAAIIGSPAGRATSG